MWLCCGIRRVALQRCFLWWAPCYSAFCLIAFAFFFSFRSTGNCQGLHTELQPSSLYFCILRWSLANLRGYPLWTWICNPPVSVSQSAEITHISQRVWPAFTLVLFASEHLLVHDDRVFHLKKKFLPPFLSVSAGLLHWDKALNWNGSSACSWRYHANG